MFLEIDPLTQSIRRGQNLTREQCADIFDAVVKGRLSPEAIEEFLVALADKGETADEIVGAAEVMRRHVTPIPCDFPYAIDTCGTGGDGISTFNVSTAAAIVAAAAGAVVAKHGNRSNSRKSGSAEVLHALGVNIEASAAVVSQCLREARIGFLFAARLHPAAKRVLDIRRKIGRPTIFNLLGPLTNPAQVRHQIIGVPRPHLVETLGGALRDLGTTRALVVHGSDGLCDLTITGPSMAMELSNGQLRPMTVTPEDFGLKRASLDTLRIDDPQSSAIAIREILAGQKGSRRDHTLLNAGAALWIAGVANDMAEGIRLAASAIDTGQAAATLQQLITLSNANTDENPATGGAP